MRVVAPCSADRTLAHQVSQVHCAGASAVWHYTLDMSSLRPSLSLPLPHGATPMTMLPHVQRSFPWWNFIRIMSAPQKTEQHLIPYTTGLFPGAKLIAHSSIERRNFLHSWQGLVSINGDRRCVSRVVYVDSNGLLGDLFALLLWKRCRTRSSAFRAPKLSASYSRRILPCSSV